MSEVQPVQYQQTNRIAVQDILPGSIDNAALAAGVIKNAGVTQAAATINNGATLTFTSTLVSSLKTTNRIGAVPFQCAFFLTSVTQNNLIPFGSGVTPSQWVITGPHAMPEFTPGGTDGNNLVFKTAITNNTGSQQAIIFVSDLRVVQSGKSGK